MSRYKVDFGSMPWEEGREGVRVKTHSNGKRQIRLVKFDSGEGFEHWCETGHIGYVLEGGLVIEYSGDLVSYAKGDGLFIPEGEASKHRGVSIIPGTRLLMIEDV